MRRREGPRGGSERAWVLDAVAGISDALIVMDARGHVVYRNPAAERVVELGVFDDMAGRTSTSRLFRPDERTPMSPDELPLRRALARGESVADLGMFIRDERVPSGAHILVSASPLRDRAGRVRGAACILRDITTIRQQEAQLQEGERQKKAILDNIPDMAWLKDEGGRFVLVNQPLASAAGRASPEDVVGLTDADLWPRELAERYRVDDEEIVRTRLRRRIEEPFVDASGRRCWMETIKTCILDDRGEVIGTTGISRDITHRRQLEEHLRAARDALEQRIVERTAELAAAQEHLVRQERLAVLGQLAGGVAHQIRNPLAAIMNATYVLRRHLAPGQHRNVEDALRIIHDEVRHANVIITGLLDYARVRTPDRHPTSVVEVLERILASDSIAPNIHVVRRLPDADPVVRSVDADQLHGAIANVVRNAVDAMPDGGELDVALTARGDELVITVSDTGAGISPHVRAHLFEPLHSTKPMGVGLGLVTARRFVEAHGGRITCVDVPKGARFEIRLPTS